MTELSEEQKNKLARGLLDTIVKECELHGVEFISLPDKMQKLVQDVGRAGMRFSAKVMMEIEKNETPY